MKKTIQITLSNTVFYTEEEAYGRLSSYLESIKSYFSSYEDKDEIVADIEQRIAEKFLVNKSKIITLRDTDLLIQSMGSPSDFKDSDPEYTQGVDINTSKTIKRLFRNPDDKIIAGVASGLAVYFRMDPTIVRLIFVIIVLLGGAGIMIYLILWLIVPQAKTNTEKLQMRGEKVTIKSIKKLVQDRLNELKK